MSSNKAVFPATKQDILLQLCTYSNILTSFIWSSHIAHGSVAGSSSQTLHSTLCTGTLNFGLRTLDLEFGTLEVCPKLCTAHCPVTSPAGPPELVPVQCCCPIVSTSIVQTAQMLQLDRYSPPSTQVELGMSGPLSCR